MKLFIATEFPPDALGGGPAVIRQLLRDFPGEIHWWSVRRGGDAASAFGFSVSSSQCCDPGKLMPARKLTRLKAWLMEHLWAPLAARSLRAALARVKPDCIWVIPHDWSIFPLHELLKTSTGRPKLHVTIQDYPDAHDHARVWGEGRVGRMVRMQEELYVRADSCDATSLPMLEDLEQRTGAKGRQMLHQGLEPEDFAFLENFEPQVPSSKPIRIAYAGTILVEKEFALFAGLLEKMRNEQRSTDNQQHSRMDIRLELWGAHSYAGRSWFREEWMTEHGNLPERALLEELRKCDWGFIPMALEDRDPRYNRFSFPTKFITYLAAGLPIIAMGHPESSVVKMADVYNVGMKVKSSENIKVSKLAKALQDPEEKAKYHPEILQCANDHFEAGKMRKVLWNCLGVETAGD